MTTFYVRSRTLQFSPDEGPSSRTLVIEADYFQPNGGGGYDFYKKNPVAKKAGTLVASVPGADVFSVTEEDAYQADFICGYPEDDEDDFDFDFADCPGCDQCCPSPVEPAPVPPTPAAVPDQVNEPLAKVEYRLWADEPTWGVVAEGRFIPWWEKRHAEFELLHYYPGLWKSLASSPLEESPLVEVPNE